MGNQRYEHQNATKGTIVKTDGIEGSMTQAGNPIAYAYNLDDLYITANVDEKIFLTWKKATMLM